MSILLIYDHFFLRHRHSIEEDMHRRFAEAPSSLMGPHLIDALVREIEFILVARGCDSTRCHDRSTRAVAQNAFSRPPSS